MWTGAWVLGYLWRAAPLSGNMHHLPVPVTVPRNRRRRTRRRSMDLPLIASIKKDLRKLRTALVWQKKREERRLTNAYITGSSAGKKKLITANSKRTKRNRHSAGKSTEIGVQGVESKTESA
jgi:hypothetical protein